MEKLFFVFCKGDLMLEKLPDGTYTIPYGENAPTETKPWTNMMNVSPSCLPHPSRRPPVS